MPGFGFVGSPGGDTGSKLHHGRLCDAHRRGLGSHVRHTRGDGGDGQTKKGLVAYVTRFYPNTTFYTLLELFCKVQLDMWWLPEGHRRTTGHRRWQSHHVGVSLPPKVAHGNHRNLRSNHNNYAVTNIFLQESRL